MILQIAAALVLAFIVIIGIGLAIKNLDEEGMDGCTGCVLKTAGGLVFFVLAGGLFYFYFTNKKAAEPYVIWMGGFFLVVLVLHLAREKARDLARKRAKRDSD